MDCQYAGPRTHPMGEDFISYGKGGSSLCGLQTLSAGRHRTASLPGSQFQVGLKSRDEP